jgi:hypothetical protein
MRRYRRRTPDYLRRSDYLVDDVLPAEERGKAMLLLLAHACVALLVLAAEATWALATGVRVWRRRELGLPASVRAGVNKRTFTVFLAARLAYAIFQRLVLAKLKRMAKDYDRQRGESA